MPEKLTFVNSLGESIVFSYEKPFILQNIEGLGGASANIQTQKAPFQDGETFIDSILEPIELFFEVGIFANTSKRLFEHRNTLSRILNPKLGVGTLFYVYEGGTKAIKGTIEMAPSFPSGIDNKSVGYQKSIFTLMCLSPYWEDAYESLIEMADIIPRFSFPIEIIEGGIEFGDISGGYYTVNNTGHLPAPLTIEFKGNVINPVIKDVLTNDYIKVNTTISKGDVLVITTEFGNKKVILRDADGKAYNRFGLIDLESTFFKLKIGNNYLAYDADSGVDSASVTIKYKQRYIGV